MLTPPWLLPSTDNKSEHTIFNESALTLRSSLQPAIDLATAIHAYGGNPPSWMTAEYAFEIFSMAEESISGNITTDTNVYSAYLDCQAISLFEYFATYDSSSGGSTTIQIDNRGCQVSHYFQVANSTPIYAVGWNTQCHGSDYSRISIFSGLYSEVASPKLANLSISSCISSYWRTSGSLTVSFRSSASPEYVSIAM